MAVRAPLNTVLRDLLSPQERALEEAIVRASLLLEQEHRYRSYEHVLQRKTWLNGLPADRAEFPPAAIRRSYERLLPEEFLGLRLHPDEADAIVAGLLALLDQGVRVGSVIFALGKSMRQDLIPRIAAELRRHVGVDAWAVRQAVYTLDDLLYLPERGRLSRVQQAVFQEACAAIGSAVLTTRPCPPSSPERGYVPDPREAAVSTLSVLSHRFASRRLERLLTRHRQSHHAGLMGVALETKPMPNGDVAVFGPLRTGFPDELQAPAMIHRDGGPPTRARYVGCYFDLGGWPPRMAILLRGVSGADLPPGSLFSADMSEQMAIIRGMAEGTLELRELFGEVRRDGLLNHAFMVLYRSPEDVRVPLPEPDPRLTEIRDKLRELDQRVAKRARRRRL